MTTATSAEPAGTRWLRERPTIADFVQDPQLLGLSVSPAQLALLKAIYGMPLAAAELPLWRACTGRVDYHPPRQGFSEVTVVAGARAGKDSRIAAPVVCYEAVAGDHAKHLHPGERGVIPIVAQNADAAKIAFGHIRSNFERSPLLSALIEDEPLATSLALCNGISIVCFPCTMKSMRGYSIPVAVMDELAFYRLEGQADSDVEIQASIRRGMIHFPMTRLIKISTPYAKSGVLYEDFRRAYGHEDPDLLVWRASSLLMNPVLMTERLEREKRLDPTRFAREYEAEFAEALESFLRGAWVDEAMIKGRHQLAGQNQYRYIAAVDPSGGGADAFTLSICHVEGDKNKYRVVQDVMKGWAGENLEGAVTEISTICKAYSCREVYGDRYASGWVRQRFRSQGIHYEDVTLRNPEDYDKFDYLDKSSAYIQVEPLFATCAIEILDHPVLIRELKLLERRTRVGGKDLIDHPDGGHDDYANALAVAAAKCRDGKATPIGMAPTVPSHIAQIGEPARPGGLGFTGQTPGMAPAAGKVGGQAAHLSRRYQ